MFPVAHQWPLPIGGTSRGTGVPKTGLPSALIETGALGGIAALPQD